jgi:hypothetical protein
VTYETAFGLDGWIYRYLIHTTQDQRQYSAIVDLHSLPFTATYVLGFSVYTSPILATDLSQCQCDLKSHMDSFTA